MKLVGGPVKLVYHKACGFRVRDLLLVFFSKVNNSNIYQIFILFMQISYKQILRDVLATRFNNKFIIK